MDAALLESLSPDELCDSMCQLAGVVNATTAALFEQVAAYDRRGLWRADGAVDMAAWLVGALAIDRRTALDWVAKAHALARLPETAAAFAEGRISGDQLRSLVTLARRAEDDTRAAETVRMCAGRRDGAGAGADDGGAGAASSGTGPGGTGTGGADATAGNGEGAGAEGDDDGAGSPADDSAGGAAEAGPSASGAAEPGAAGADAGRGAGAGGDDDEAGGGVAGCDADLVALGERCSSAHLRRLVSLTRPVPASGDDDDHPRRELSAWWDEDRAVLDIRGRLCGDAAMTATPRW